jgi:flagellar hook-associated protein 3 FlgL
MRVNPNFAADMVSQVNQAQQNANDAALQLSSGRRVNQPSDDPAAAAAMVNENSYYKSVDQFTANSDTLTNVLNTGSSTLASAVTLLQKALTLGTEGANGTNNTTNLTAIATEVSDIKSQMLSIANTSFAGQYLFAGTATGTAPYVADATTPTQIDYVGNSQQAKVQIGTGLSVSANLPGNSIFSQSGADVFGSLQTLITALQSGSTTAVGNAVTGINSAIGAVSDAQSSYSSTVNEITNNENFLSQEKLNITSYQTTLVGADTATAATNSSHAQTVLTAAVAAAAQVDQQVNLLNYLK